MKLLREQMEKYGINNIDEKLELFDGYRKRILEWNEKVNLTAITDYDEFEQKHYKDSLYVLKSNEYIKSKNVLDLGTGGGFPGIPLAIVSPEKKFVLMDSLKKRLKIIDEITAELNIQNVITVHGRAEELGRKKEYRESFDLVISRAVANLSTLSEYCIPFVKKGGTFVSYKGSDGNNELEVAKKAISALGGKFVRMEDVELNHKLIYILKNKATDKKYPRKPGMPGNSPL